ncbi:putative repeat protein (TIGR03943 family) [Paenibacillus sp. DS2015]|uniref:TIGR03943 family putative permease subunit n=1 Tax=Paenibacillus sp. DS2015 TaxID=3373917 RepID=UPI003D1F1EFB
MISPRALRIHYLVRTFILLGFAYYINHLIQTDSLHYYIAPRMEPFIRACPIPLCVLAFFVAWHALFGQGEQLCDCQHPVSNSIIRNTCYYGLFILPLTLGYLLPIQTLGSAAVDQKGMNIANPYHSHSATTAAIQSEKQQPKFIPRDEFAIEFADLAKLIYEEPIIQVRPEIFSETIGAINLFKSEFVGKSIELSGFVYRDAAMSEARMVAIGRFLVQCCTADATSFGVLVNLPDQPTYPMNTWIHVRGVIGVSSYEGEDVITIQPVEVQEIPQPLTPYIYTSPDSVEQYKKLKALDKTNNE